MIHVMCYKRQGKQELCNELPFSTVGWVVAREPEGFILFCGSNPEGSHFFLSLYFFLRVRFRVRVRVRVRVSFRVRVRFRFRFRFGSNIISQSLSDKVLLGDVN